MTYSVTLETAHVDESWTAGILDYTLTGFLENGSVVTVKQKANVYGGGDARLELPNGRLIWTNRFPVTAEIGQNVVLTAHGRSADDLVTALDSLM